MKFEQAYEEFLNFHVATRNSTEAERLMTNQNFAEKRFAEQVWWPAFHNFDGLKPQYEVRDFKDGHRYLDFAYIQPHFRIAIEIDGFGPHWKDITNEQFSDHIQRQNHLVIDGWHVLRFAYQDVRSRPRQCQQTIQQLIGRLISDTSGLLQNMKVLDREILRIAMGSPCPITSGDIVTRLDVERHTAARHLKNLVRENWLQPLGGPQHTYAYEIHPSRHHVQL